MSKDTDPRAAYQEALIGLTDCTVQLVPATELVSSSHDASIDPLAHRMLAEAGGISILYAGIQVGDKFRYADTRSAKVTLDAHVVSTLNDRFPPELLILTATRRSKSGRTGKYGLRMAVGHRVRGSIFDIVPLGVPEELAYAANAVANWRSLVAADSVRPSTAVYVRREPQFRLTAEQDKEARRMLIQK